MTLSNVAVIPKQYKTKGNRLSFIQVIVEAIVVLFIIEVVMALIWTKTEVIVVFLLQKHLLKAYEKWSLVAANVMVTLLAGMIFSYAVMVTGNFDMIMESTTKIFTKVKGFFKTSSEIRRKKRNC